MQSVVIHDQWCATVLITNQHNWDSSMFIRPTLTLEQSFWLARRTFWEKSLFFCNITSWEKKLKDLFCFWSADLLNRLAPDHLLQCNLAEAVIYILSFTFPPYYNGEPSAPGGSTGPDKKARPFCLTQIFFLGEPKQSSLSSGTSIPSRQWWLTINTPVRCSIKGNPCLLYEFHFV